MKDNTTPIATSSTTTISSQDQQQNEALKSQFDIDMIGLFGDIFNAITLLSADSLDELEQRLNVLHDDYVTREKVSINEAQYQKSILSKSLNQMIRDMERATSLYVDQAEVYAAKSVFSLEKKEYLDPAIVRSIYQQSVLASSLSNQQQQPQQQQQQTTLVTTDATTTGTTGTGTTMNEQENNHSLVNEQELDEMIVELRRQIQSEKLKNDSLENERRTLSREVKFAQRNISKFQFTSEEMLKEDNVESWDALIHDLAKNGQELNEQILAHHKQRQQRLAAPTSTMVNDYDPMEIDFGSSSGVASAFHPFDSHVPLNPMTGNSEVSGGGQSDLQQLLKKLSSGN